MSFELILPFLRPIESLLLDESVSEIMGNPDASWWYERDGIMLQEKSISFDADKLPTGLEVIANQLGQPTCAEEDECNLDVSTFDNPKADWRYTSWLNMPVSAIIVLGVSVLCGLWWFVFPDSVLRFYRKFYGSRFGLRPFFIRVNILRQSRRL